VNVTRSSEEPKSLEVLSTNDADAAQLGNATNDFDVSLFQSNVSEVTETNQQE
jgi:hypothetical protein